ncbi:MAG: NnrS family protein [Verrucomicrobiota bacterium]|nr:NnrS family protein [Verrucomicrobiota bacterium]
MSGSRQAVISSQNQPYYSLAVKEPFRILFILGSLIAVFGIMLWPLNHWGVIGFYPNIAHARIMVEGFLGCFVIGFLGTALPRILDVEQLTVFETPIFALLMIFVVALHFLQKTFWGDILFAVTFSGFMMALLVRAILRKDIPPPGFILVPAGLGSGVIGAFILAIGQVSPPEPFLYLFAQLLLYQGFLLLPVMGIGAFLLPRFFGEVSKHNFPESMAVPPGWMGKALVSGLAGGLVIVSFAIEAGGQIVWGCLLRGAVVLAYFLMEMNLLQNWKARGTLALSLRIALICFPAGLFAVASAPLHRVALLHVFFMGGFCLLCFTVASRVVMGHSGHSHLLSGRLKPMIFFLVMLILALLCRVSADFIPEVRLSHYDYAAILLSGGILVWLMAYLPLMKMEEPK